MTTYAEWHEQEQQLTEDEYEALADYLDNQHEDIDSEYESETIAQFRDAYMGQWGSMEDFIEQLVRDTSDIPHWLDQHIDWTSLTEEWSHDYWESDNGHIFRAH